MNPFIAVLLAFALLGALDKALSGRLGLAGEFDSGLAAMGSLCLSMMGIYCLSAVVLAGTGAFSGALPFDAAVLPGMLLAPDMGGWPSARALAASQPAAAYAGILVSSTLGTLLSFTLPIALGTLPSGDHLPYMQGVIWGVVTIPVGLLPGALVVGLRGAALWLHLLPVLVLCAALAAGLWLCPRACTRLLVLFGGAVRVMGLASSCAVIAGLFVPAWQLVPDEAVQEVLVIILKIAVTMCGAMVASRLLLRYGGRWVAAAARRLSVNEYAVLGLVTSAVSNVAMLPLFPRMDGRGKRMNAAAAVAGAFVVGGQMAFVASVESSRTLAAYFVCKLLAGAAAVWLTLRFPAAE